MDLKELNLEELNEVNGGGFWDFLPDRLTSLDAFLKGIQEETDIRERYNG